MDTLQHWQEMTLAFWPAIIALFVWEAVWKLIAMWRAGRNNQLAWFVCIALINTAGILPIIYLLIHTRGSERQNATA